jgi:hypothetical protein
VKQKNINVRDREFIRVIPALLPTGGIYNPNILLVSKPNNVYK